MNQDARKQIVKAYFDGLAAKDISRVPWAKDATLRTPLNPAGGESELICGREAILDFFSGILPAVRSLRFLNYYAGDGGWSAGEAEISVSNGKTLYILDAFRVEKARLSSSRTITIRGQQSVRTTAVTVLSEGPITDF
jgi:hypothetical protein